MKVLNFFYPIIALALMSFSPVQEVNSANISSKNISYYVVLETTQQDIEGDHYHISDVITVTASCKLDAKFAAVTSFENQLHQRFPQGIFEINNQSIIGVYNAKFDAEEIRITTISNRK